MRCVYISESKIALLNESDEEVTFLRFFIELKKFIADLLTDPVHARPSEMLVSHGLGNDKLRHMLRNEGIIVRTEKIDEPYNEETGKMESMYYLSYKVPKKDFKKKIRRLYQKLFENN